MNPIRVIVRPETYIENAKYLLRLHKNNKDNPVYISVRFVSYDPCPGIVKVCDGEGRFWRIPREDVYSFGLGTDG